MLALALVIFVGVVEIKATEISCATKEPFKRNDTCCYLNGVISEENVEIGDLENLNIHTILLNDNRNIKFLPVKVHEKFPNIKLYWAENARIEKITASNFAGLTKLRLLNLSRNRIEIIPDDCFQGLRELQEINLESNGIKKVNGMAFANLPQLSIVNLNRCKCISQTFTFGSDSSGFRRRVSRRCGSTGDAEKKITCDDLPINCKPPWARSKFPDKDSPQCCDVKPETVIDAPDFTFEKNSTYIDFYHVEITNQRLVEFLPILVHEQFPKLKYYYVTNTPIRRIIKKNFEKLDKLVLLVLDTNRIEIIKSDTFEDLLNLERIEIKNQPLLALNAQAFTNLPKIEAIDLGDNLCISKFFFKDSFMTRGSEIIDNSCGFTEFDTVGIECESFVDTIHVVESCEMKWKTEINATNFVVAEIKDEGVGSIDFSFNKKVEYLPYKIFMQFPNLEYYFAWGCSIKQISRYNFEYLEKLLEIRLLHNQILQISRDTFMGLNNLGFIDLESNQIKSIHAQTFDHLSSLAKIDLRRNECIDDILAPLGHTAECIRGKSLLPTAFVDCQKTEPRLHHSLKNLTHKIIKQCVFTETRQRNFGEVSKVECEIEKTTDRGSDMPEIRKARSCTVTFE